MKSTAFRRILITALVLTPLSARAAEADKTDLARKAHDILRTTCYRCHGQDGNVEGGMNYILDIDKLIQRKKIIPGKAELSPLYKKVAKDLMPPGDEKPRPGEADKAVLKQWIDAGAPRPTTTVARTPITDADVLTFILADLEKIDKRSRRFTRYFTLAHLYNAGLGEDELQTYRNALSKLVNSLSWHAKIWRPEAIDPAKTVLRIDLRNFMWDANLWNRILNDYPYGIFLDTATSRAVAVSTATRMPVVRADWFIATASRAPLYYDLLQIPGNLNELERQLRVDVATNIQQERVARAAFNGSGVSRNNRVLERHDSVHGAYWRTYDFDAIPQNLVDRQNLLPDRRNIFAYPLGPGQTQESFQHAGGEVIFNLPNGLQAYVLVNANNQRLDKAPTAIVSDPKRPDRAVEAGLSCMSCHYRGILPKDDQVREYVEKNPKAFGRADAELIKALYPPHKKMQALMDEDHERFKKSLEACGARVSPSETVMTMALRYEADLDLPTVAAELSLSTEEFLSRLEGSPLLARNFGSLKVEGGTVARQVLIQAFGDMVKELKLGVLFQAAQVGQALPDNTGEIDPLEGRTTTANSLVFSPDGKFAIFASSDKTVRLIDLDAGREVKRMVGHTHSVWSVAFTPDGKRAISGGADNTVRIWDVEAGREIKKLEGHTGLVTGVAVAPGGKRALSVSYDQTILWWDIENFKELSSYPAPLKYINCVAIAPDGTRALLGGEKALVLWDIKAGKELSRLDGHTDAVVSVALSTDGKRALSGSDDRTLRLWDMDTCKPIRVFTGHSGPVKCVAFGPGGNTIASGSTDSTVRLWDVTTTKEMGRFQKHAEPVVSVIFTSNGKWTFSGSSDAAVRFWDLGKVAGYTVPKELTPSKPVP
ncbi:MAG: WD40 repeat domain-containing protein [Gemmataceae bacterium]|nr:WD40 repeat domain-containing protein [Gemmataceae bacterium]